MPGKVFISYRHSDAADQARDFHAVLERNLGDRTVFLDTFMSTLGTGLRRQLEFEIMTSFVVVVVIGPGWLDARNTDGSRRLDDALDFVRFELQMAEKHGKIVIPVYFGGADTFDRSKLPEKIRDFGELLGCKLAADDFETDAQELAVRLRRMRSALFWRSLATGFAKATLVLGFGLAVWAAIFLFEHWIFENLFPVPENRRGFWSAVGALLLSIAAGLAFVWSRSAGYLYGALLLMFLNFQALGMGVVLRTTDPSNRPANVWVGACLVCLILFAVFASWFQLLRHRAVTKALDRSFSEPAG